MNRICVDTKGYGRVSVNGKWRKAHRIIMEIHLLKNDPESIYLCDDKLRRDILIHHKDGNKLNNSIGNLICLTDKEHSKIHLDKYPGMSYSEKQKMWHSDNCKCGETKSKYSIVCRSCEFKSRKGRGRNKNVKNENNELYDTSEFTKNY